MKSRIKKTLQNIVLEGGCLVGSVSLSLTWGCIDGYQSTRTTIAGASAQHVAATDTSLSLQQSQALGVLGGTLQVLGNQQAMRESKSEVNVNVNTQRNSQNYENQNKRDRPLVFTCAKDIDTYSSWEEVEYKNVFYPGEKIRLYGDLSRKYPDGTPTANQTTHLKTGRSYPFCDRKLPVEKNLIENAWYDDAKLLLDKFGEGEFENKWYVKIKGKWEYVGSIRFFVIDNRPYARDNH